MVESPQFRSFAPEELAQVYAWFDRMRAEQPVAFDPQYGVWHLFRYQDVQTVLTDHARFSSETRGHPAMPFTDSFLEDTLLTRDPPDHRKLRNLVNLAFTPRALAPFSERVAAITQELLDAVRNRDTVDIVADIAFPLPAKVIAELVGVPPEDWDIFKRWARGESATSLPPPQSQEQMRIRMRSIADEQRIYFRNLLDERRRKPQSDILSTLSVAEVDGEHLSEQELVNFCMLLLGAGQETTKNLIASAILCFDAQPGLIEQLRRSPELMPAAIEEVLRLMPPAQLLHRLTTEEVELSGQRIPAGQVVQGWLAAANRDPAQFANPNQFDLRRETNRHMAFGYGIHFCIGAPLARLEARVALPMLLEQLPNLRRVPGEPVHTHLGLVLVVDRLPVTFQGARG